MHKALFLWAVICLPPISFSVPAGAGSGAMCHSIICGCSESPRYLFFHSPRTASCLPKREQTPPHLLLESWDSGTWPGLCRMALHTWALDGSVDTPGDQSHGSTLAMVLWLSVLVLVEFLAPSSEYHMAKWYLQGVLATDNVCIHSSVV